ncbi:MAG: hypothetical protein HKN07_08810 [Acidimicrobiia bacterium]|nr:hypothetical protein [Acidimicrobiia bacterium]
MGAGVSRTGNWIAHGRTTAAADDPFGHFDASFTGMRTFWDGSVGANPFEFTGVLTLYD